MRRLSIVVLMPLALVLMASGGRLVGHGQSAAQLAQAAAKAFGSAKSVRLSGSLATSTGSSNTPVGSTKFDLVLYSNDDLEGSLTLKNLLIKIVLLNGIDYYQAPAAYWQEVGGLPATLAKRISPLWISTPNTSSAGFGDSFEIGSFSSQLNSTTTGAKFVGHEKVDGHAAIGVKLSNGAVLWVASSGTPYPLEEVKSGNGAGTITFSGWNSFKLPTAPRGAVSLSSLSK
jgi:hypothetical protein